MVAIFSRKGYDLSAIHREEGEMVSKALFNAKRNILGEANSCMTYMQIKVDGKYIRGGAERTTHFYK